MLNQNNLDSLLVYVVDDEPFALEVDARIVASLPGTVVQSFRSGEEALAACKQTPPDVLVTDHQMPGGMDGIALIRAVRTLPACACIPICMLTASGKRDVWREAQAAGAMDFATKPVDLPTFEVRMGNLIQIRRQQRALESSAHC